MKGALAVFAKELIDALRDRRTLLTVLLSSVLMGPLVLVLLSGLIASLETRAERRVMVASGLEHAPDLRNYIERQGYTLEEAPADYEALLRASRLGEPVVVVPDDFAAQRDRGDAPRITVVSDSSNRQAEAGTSRVLRVLDGYNRERGALTLALRGVPPALLAGVDVQEVDLASVRSRATQFTSMLPFFVLMAVLYGALHAALDTTTGERERGSLEPLLTNPVAPAALVLGKWGAVAAVAMLIALLSVCSFLPAQMLIQSETLRSMFTFGAREALAFLAVLLPLAAALSALLMAVAIRCKTFKEAQANNTVVILAVSLLPLVALFNQSGDKPWFMWVPALAQYTLMNRVLRAETLSAMDVGVPALVSVLLAVACLAFVAQRLRGAAVR